MIKDSFSEVIEELEEGKFKDALQAAALSTGLLLSSNNVAAKTDFNKLHADHEVTSRYEHGGLNNLAVTLDNYGGYSYGKNQISTERRNGKPSTFDFFLKFMKDHDPTTAVLFDLAGGWQEAYKGSKDFKHFWKNIANKPEFEALYDSFILHTQVMPTYKAMDASKNKSLDKITTWASENEAVQAAVQSTIIQHGPAGARDIFRKVMEIYKPKSPKSFIHELYKYRGKRYKAYKTRYDNEGKDVKAYHAQLTKPAPQKRT